MDGVNQWPVPASLSGNVLNAENMTQYTAQLAARLKLDKTLLQTRNASTWHLSYTVHLNTAQRTIPCDTVHPVMPLSWYLSGLLDMISPQLSRSKPANTDSLHEFPPLAWTPMRSTRHASWRAPVLRLNLITVRRDRRDNVERNLTSAQTDLPMPRSCPLIGWKRRHSSNPLESGASRASGICRRAHHHQRAKHSDQCCDVTVTHAN